MHETVFYLAKGKTIRNLHVGTPIIVPVTSDFSTETDCFINPAEKELTPIISGDETTSFARLDQTELTGVYNLASKNKNVSNNRPSERQLFVLNYDHAESVLTPLSDVERERLSEIGKLKFISTEADLQEEWLTDESRSEFWHLLLFLFLGILVAEVYMTRRLVQGGHAVVEPA